MSADLDYNWTGVGGNRGYMTTKNKRVVWSSHYVWSLPIDKAMVRSTLSASSLSSLIRISNDV